MAAMIGEQPSGISPFLHQIFARISDREKAVMKAKKEHENAESVVQLLMTLGHVIRRRRKHGLKKSHIEEKFVGKVVILCL